MSVRKRWLGALLTASALALPLGAQALAARAPQVVTLSDRAQSPTIELVRGHKLRNTAIVVGGAMAAHHLHKKHQQKKARKRPQRGVAANTRRPNNAQQPAR